MTNKAANGFSLANLGAILLIVGIEVVVALPRINEGLRAHRLDSAAEDVWQDTYRAQMLAIKEKRAVRIEFDHASYTVVRVATGEVVASRDLASTYPEITVAVTDSRQEILFDRTGAPQGGAKEVEIQGPTGIRRFTILATGNIGKLS